VTATSLGLWRGKPPLKIHYFDISLHNPADGPRWLVLPSDFRYAGETPAMPVDDVAELQAFVLAERPRVVMVKGVGAELWAVRLPAHGSVRLRRVAIESGWEDVPATAELEVIVAKDLTIGGSALDALLGVDVASETGADVQAPGDAADPRAVKYWHPVKNAPSKLALEIESRARVSVPLSQEPMRP
jgi:hypothetical protein